jgi:transposase
MRQDIKEEVHFYIMNDIQPNFAKLARQFNCDPRTAKRYYEMGLNPPEKTDKNKRPSKLDPFKDIITDKLELGCTAMAIFKFIQKKGFDGGYTIVREFCQKHKLEKTRKATIRVETNPGVAGQVDWKEDMVLHDKFGNSYKFNLFLYVLHYSKLKYISLTWDRKQDTLFKCLNEAFDETGGVPQEIWFDNMRTVVNQSRTQHRKVIFNERFYGFSKDAGFQPIACRAYRPQTKGTVESLAKFVERLKPYDYEFYDAVELISLVNNLNFELNYQEISQATWERPIEKWEKQEKEHLRPLNEQLLRPYFESDISRIVTNESMVNFRKCKYSVPVKYIGCEVEIETDIDDQNIQIYYNGELIQSHQITDNHLNYHPNDMFEILKSDVMKYKKDEEIQEYITNTLSQYDDV